MRTITEHAASCGSSLNFLGESRTCGLVSHCPKCNTIFWFHTSSMITYGTASHYAVNFGAVLGQVATGGVADHLQRVYTTNRSGKDRFRFDSNRFRTPFIL